MEGLSAVELEGVSVGYDSFPVLEGVSMAVPHPSVAVVMGPNGSGKTTLLRTLLGLLRPMEGRVRVLGLDPSEDRIEVRRMVGYVPQRESISAEIPLRVMDVVLMGRLARRRPPRRVTPEDVEAAERALEEVGLPDLGDAVFNELSGGQRQRVLLARALASDPKLLLLDEPLSATDAASRDVIAGTIARKRGEGVSSIIVTHDVNPLAEVTDYLALLSGGRLVAFGRVAEVLTPPNLSTVYGGRVRIFREGGLCFAIVGDRHG